MNFTVCLCYGEMPVLNGNIGAFKSYAESLKLHNSYFVGSTCVGILFLSEDWNHCTKVTELVIFHSLKHAYSTYMLCTLLLKKKK